ncbi:MAG: hypothetical protein WC485_00380 [Opitutaceae bacterium]
MAKLEASHDGPATRNVMKSWYGVLRNVDLAAAKAASHQMHAGEIEEPKGFDRHPAAIRRACGVARRQRDSETPRYDADGNQMFVCLTCFDDGWVRCWHPASVAEVAANGITAKPLYAAVFPCKCRAGDVWARCFPLSPRFDAKMAMPLVGCASDRDNQQRLAEWIAGREPVRPENYEPAFADPS